MTDSDPIQAPVACRRRSGGAGERRNGPVELEGEGARRRGGHGAGSGDQPAITEVRSALLRQIRGQYAPWRGGPDDRAPLGGAPLSSARLRGMRCLFKKFREFFAAEDLLFGGAP